MNKGYWVHKNSVDVFYEILAVPYKGPNYVKIKYWVWNKNEFGKPFLIFTAPLKAKIMNSELKNWVPYVDDRL